MPRNILRAAVVGVALAALAGPAVALGQTPAEQELVRRYSPIMMFKENPDPLRKDPIAHVNTGCVGCGLCGEVAHAAILCPSFFRAEIVYNPSKFERVMASLRQMPAPPRGPLRHRPWRRCSSSSDPFASARARAPPLVHPESRRAPVP